MNEFFTTKNVMIAVNSLVVTTLLFGTFYTIDEGHVGIVKRFSEAKEQVNPGLHFKIPMVDSVEVIEVRTRKNTEILPAATSEQMPLDAEVSVNWTVDKSEAFKLFVEYGGLDQFESRILDTRLRSASKAAISRYTAENIIINRAKVITEIAAELDKTMSTFPVKLDSVQLDNVKLPDIYLQSIQTKQTQKNLSEAEKYTLEKQKYVAQQAVNTAEAEAAATEMRATAEANAIRMKGLAEADAIEAKAKSLRDNPLIVQLTLAQKWDGAQPKMISGDSGMILQMKSPLAD